LSNADEPLAAIADYQSPLIQGLACATLQPGLRSILVFDTSPANLRSAAAQWAEMLSVTTGQAAVKPIYLGPIDAEETLWGNLALTQTVDTPKFAWKAGLLGGPDDDALRLIVIPDLTRLSLAAARACIALMGNEVAQLERHGQQASWRSRICWLAGCNRSQVKFLSPHLLDRFSLRLTGQDLPTVDRAGALQDWFSSLTEPPQTGSILSPEWLDRLQSAQQQKPSIAPAAYERGLAYIAETTGQGMRRELALLRLAQAQTQLAGLDEVTIEQVDRAAQLIGLKLLAPIVQPPVQPRPTETQIAAPEPKPQPERSPSIDPPELPTQKSEVYEPDSATDFPAAPVEFGQSQDPYPEDHIPTEREAASLRLPPRRFRSATVGRGTIVGVEPATIPQDIAWVSTLLEAAKYQGFRRQGDESRLLLRSADLRRYRRAAVPEQLLMLVLDHTCLRDCQWQAALLPYLQWAYVERASVCLVQVGAAGRELQAEKVSAQSVLVPRIRSGLESGPGMATPLAHGLDLALQTLRHALQHGRSTVHQAVLVVVSDGRGNVPLAASRMNQKPTQPVKRQGIEDALEVAGQIRSLKQVEAIVLNPQPKHYADLPVKLALALGAKIEAIPVVHAWEVDEP
jgi:magnesium chelatase subunit D